MRNYRSPRSILRNYQIEREFENTDDILEIGAGNLNLAKILDSKYRTYTGIDYSEDIEFEYLNLPKEIKKKSSFICENFLNTEFDCKYQAIIVCEVMEHIKDDRAFLKKVNNLLDNGRLYLSVPAKMKYWNIDDELFGHYRRYEREELGNLLSSSGFNVIKIISYGFPLSTLLRLARRIHACTVLKNKSKEDMTNRSKKSGINQAGKLSFLVNFLINEITLYPFNLLSTLFNNKDWSDGYIVICEK